MTVSPNVELELIGWSAVFAHHYEAWSQTKLIPARISSEERGAYGIMTTHGEFRAKIAGAYRHATKSRIDFPIVGDWVAVELQTPTSEAIIHKLIPRKTVLLRKVCGDITEQQPLAANVDYVFIVSGLDDDFNLRRIERYLTLIWDSGALPVIILNKADLLDNNTTKIDDIRDQITSIAFDTPVHFLSALNRDKAVLQELAVYFTANKTVVLVGSSGAGKSTLTNWLLGSEMQKTVEVRASDAKGRHTTTRRQLFLLPSGGMLIDTPGIRELQLWIDDKALDKEFPDIETLASQCHFNDCTHTTEPGCAVLAAIEKNALDPSRLNNYHKLHKEAQHLARKQNSAVWNSRLAERKFGKMCKKTLKQKELQQGKD